MRHQLPTRKGAELQEAVSDGLTRFPDAVQELILFSRADLERSIPSMVDGLKPGQRKILFCCFKRNIRKDVKARP